MEFTFKEMHLFKQNYDEVSPYSLFANLPEAKGEGSLVSLEKKQAYQNGVLVSGMKAVLDVLAWPEVVTHFRLEQLEVDITKRVYSVSDRRVLIEFHKTNVMISTYDSETESLRTELTNHVGASFQKHSLLKQIFNAEELICFAGLVDWLRRVALSELINQKVAGKLKFLDFVNFVKTPLNRGVLSQVLILTQLEIPNEIACKKGLNDLLKKGLVESLGEDIVIGKSTILFAINFLVPITRITLELYDLTNDSKVLTAKEKILQATPKDALSLSAAAEGYLTESLTSAEVLNKIFAYLASPRLNHKNRDA